MSRLFFICVLLLAGCASSSVTTKDSVKYGVLESITPIEMDASSNTGSMAGGIFGQIGGANTGAGRGAVVGSVLGSVLGGTLGHSAGIDSRSGLELWVKLDNAEQSTYVMQPGKPDAFRVGDRVRIVQKKGVVRVETDMNPAP
ncbi:MAG TPA: hypothetical protein DE312_11665 [Gallionella sp.]|jgi:outer membrane lipoprotein SlyB|nr:hypothetical protein [Gallionella sp.]OGS68251.1 MAG: hypothetical protein A2Z87_10290 [Gallionellales bacterium GWA2_54_124]OGT19125.1 MAG: hypothetical protein A2522_05650 [Gallionellales bacterium RIFOXYD12_FULL_53_10]HCI53949.1 hypothetical protein [Gallionella sp.]